MTPAVSVTLCCYNSERYLEETLQSIFAQTYTDWELVIINDGSTDSTAQIIQRHLAEGRRIVYHSEANAGLGAARNKAIELSQGEFIALVDHDDLWHPEKLERQLKLVTGRPEVGVVYSETGVLVSNDHTNAPSLRRTCYRGRVLMPLVLGNFIPCSSIVIRRSAIDAVGRFNPAFIQVEEYDLMIRLAERYEFDYVSEPLSTFRFHSQNLSWDGARLQSEMMTLMQRVLERNPQLPRHLGRLVMRVKRAGLSCTLGQALLLQGRIRAAHRWFGDWSSLVMALPRGAALYVLSFLPPSTIVALIGWWYRLRKWKIVRR